eukprot:1156958-Pelagomonas_calceolata.AAC.6
MDSEHAEDCEIPRTNYFGRNEDVGPEAPQRGVNSWEWQQLDAGLNAIVKQLILALWILDMLQVHTCRRGVCAACTRNAHFTALKADRG